jgi:hypothetical protein
MPPTVLKFYLTPAPFLTERFLSISSQPHACFFLPVPSLQQLQAGGRFPLSISSLRAGGDERAPRYRSRAGAAAGRRGRACVGARAGVAAGPAPAGTSLRRASRRAAAVCAARHTPPGTGQQPLRGSAWAGAGELPPGRARVRPGEPPPPPDEAKRRGSKGQGRRRHVLCDFFLFLIMLVMSLCVM